MALPQVQTAIIQSHNASSSGLLPLAVSRFEPVPAVLSPYHVLVRVRAVALNPNDHKMVTHFPIPGNGTGCDFCGIVVSMDKAKDVDAVADVQDPVPVHQPLQLGARVCGTAFPYSPCDRKDDQYRVGAFAEYVVTDSRLLLRVPDHWSDLQGAALGGVGWSTVGLAMSSPDALALPGLPSKPAENNRPVLVYGGGTATGTIACQLLNLSGYAPIAVTHSTASATLAKQYGATGIAPYTSSNTDKCLETIRSLTADLFPLRYALDCITDSDSAALCFGAIARTGGRYACLEEFQSAWHTRRIVKVKEVMGYEVLGREFDLGGLGSIYTRGVNEAAMETGRRWATEVQGLLDTGSLNAHPVREIEGKGGGMKWAEGVIEGLELLRAGVVKGRKLVVRISA